MVQLVSGRTQDDKNDSGLINVGYIGESFNNIPDGSVSYTHLRAHET